MTILWIVYIIALRESLVKYYWNQDFSSHKQNGTLMIYLENVFEQFLGSEIFTLKYPGEQFQRPW